MFFLSTVWWFDALERVEKIILKNAFEQNKKKPGLKFNPGLALIGLQTTGVWFLMPISLQIMQSFQQF